MAVAGLEVELRDEAREVERVSVALTGEVAMEAAATGKVATAMVVAAREWGAAVTGVVATATAAEDSVAVAMAVVARAMAAEDSVMAAMVMVAVARVAPSAAVETVVDCTSRRCRHPL